jgi:neopullulanase
LINSKRFLLFGFVPIVLFLFIVTDIRTSSPSAPLILKVEPPSWWTNHTINPVRLLIRGKNLTGARVRSTSAFLTPSNTRVNEAGTYLFVSLNISRSAKPGSYRLNVETQQGSASFSFEILRPLDARTNFQGITPDDVIYLIMIDRFADGDTSNDAPAGVTAVANDRKNPRAFHGGDLRGIILHLDYLKQLGVTALWLTPWYDNANGLNLCSERWCPNTYYHGYHAIDYYSVEDRFGDMKVLRELVEQAHARGIKVIQDQVANHVGSQHPWLSDPPLTDWFHGSLQQHSLNRFQNSVLLSPHANRDEVRNTLDGWFSADLPDMNQDQAEVSVYEIQNSLWWIGISGIDGIRQDTIQYMPRKFIRDLSDALHRQYSKMWMVGEVFDFDAAQTSFFIGGHTGWDGLDTHLDSVFDFPLWNSSRMAFTLKAPMRALRDQMKYDALYPDAAKVTAMLNNHDTVRFMSLPGASVEGAMMHTAFMLSVRGIPQLYYGEEIAMEGGEDPDNRRDFPGGFPGDTHSAFADGRTPIEQRMYEWVRTWLRLRREHRAMRIGRLIDLYYDDDSYIFARQIADETVVLAFNRSRNEKKVVLNAAGIGLKDGAELSSLLSEAVSGRVIGGQATLTLNGRTATAFVVK